MEKLKRVKKLLFITMVLSMFLVLSTRLSIKVSAASKPEVGVEKVFANGVPITIEEGSSPDKTKIRYGNNEYLELKSGIYEADLSDWEIYGGDSNNPTSKASIYYDRGKGTSNLWCYF